KTWTSPYGNLRFRYPATWYLIDRWPADPVTVQSGPPAGRSAGNGEYIVRFWREAPSVGTTLASLRSKDCSDGQFSRVLSCETVLINGWMWSWVNTVAVTGGEGDGNRGRLLATIADGWVYRGVGIVPAGSLQAKGLAETKIILESVSINVSTLPATGTRWSELWVGILVLLVGFSLIQISRARPPRIAPMR
ncbi:MAG: hypothetical protein ACXVQ5_12645, partial [Actinomycetota bacterium]